MGGVSDRKTFVAWAQFTNSVTQMFVSANNSGTFYLSDRKSLENERFDLMTLTKKLLFAVAATGLVATPIAAQSVSRVSAPTSEVEELGGGIGPAAIIIAIAAIGMGILLLTDDDEDPVSA